MKAKAHKKAVVSAEDLQSATVEARRRTGDDGIRTRYGPGAKVMVMRETSSTFGSVFTEPLTGWLSMKDAIRFLHQMGTK